MLYTIGYSGWKLPRLQQTIEARSAALVDIRYTPHSRWQPVWRRPYLRRTLGTRYIHIQALGNRNYRVKGAPIAIADYPTGLQQVAQLLRQWPALVLLCGCAELDACHRKLVAERLAQDLGEMVEHLPKPCGQEPSCSSV
jgi:uncharacterized protein (DUF488 family)